MVLPSKENHCSIYTNRDRQTKSIIVSVQGFMSWVKKQNLSSPPTWVWQHMWSVDVLVSAHEVVTVGLDTHCVFSSVVMPWSAGFFRSGLFYCHIWGIKSQDRFQTVKKKTLILILIPTHNLLKKTCAPFLTVILLSTYKTHAMIQVKFQLFGKKYVFAILLRVIGLI